jgi:hypothetical protein
MAWFGSVHVRTQSVEHVVAALRLLKQYDCYVGRSGAGWVGVYDKRNEEDGGAKLAELTRGLSLALRDVHVLGFLQAEDGFSYWLCRAGQQLDNHPRTIKGALFVRRGILDLCPTRHDKDRVLALIEPRKTPTPVAERLTDDELRAAIERVRAKRRAMSAAQVAKSTEERRIFPTDRYAIEVISKILAIEYYWLVYSDFSPYDLPPTFVHLDFFSK